MARSVEEGFEKLIGWLKPLPSERQKATSHKDSVLRCMVNNWGCTSLLETGSFGLGTGVLHYSDTDYFARCPADNFDDNSAMLLRKIKLTLQYTFSRTPAIEVKSPAVRIPFGKYASERLELTPVYYGGYIHTPLGQRHSYYLPDYKGGWMLSSPTAHNTYVNHHDKRLHGRLKHLIQLVKAWKFYNQVPITSFYLELRVTKYAETRSVITYDTDVKNVLKLLYNNQLASIQDPMGISGYVSACKTDVKKIAAFSKLSTAYGRAVKACDIKSANPDLAFHWWNLAYNGQFPAR
jgi:hypothetical protein